MTKLKLGISALMLLMSTHSIATDYVREISTNRDSSAGISVGVTPIPGGTYKDAYTYSSVAGENGCRGTVTWASLDNAAQCKSDVELLLKHSQSVEVADSVKGDAPYVGTGIATVTCNNGVIDIQSKECKPLGCLRSEAPKSFYEYTIVETPLGMQNKITDCSVDAADINVAGEFDHGQEIILHDSVSGFGKTYQGYNNLNYPTGQVTVKCINGQSNIVQASVKCSVSNCIVPENFNWDTSINTPRRHQGEPLYERIIGGFGTGKYNNCRPKAAVEIIADIGYIIPDAENENNYIKISCNGQAKQLNVIEQKCD